MAPVVKLQFGDVHRFTRLVNDRLHIPTVRQLFDLNSIDVDGIVEPADDRGFTFTSYPVGSTLNISGTPSQGELQGVSTQAFTQEIARLEAKVDSLIDKAASAGKPVQGQESSEMRLEDLSRQIAQLRKERLPGRWHYQGQANGQVQAPAPAQTIPTYRTFVTPTVPTPVGSSPAPVGEAPAGALISVKRSSPILTESGQKRFRNAALGKKSNMGTGNGGKGVAKCCAACSAREQCPVPVAGHNCALCSKCYRESKAFVIKQECTNETHK